MKQKLIMLIVSLAAMLGVTGSGAGVLAAPLLDFGTGINSCTPVEPVTLQSPTVITDCTQTGVQLALDGGGHLRFDCGGATTINLSSQLTISQNTVLDGGGLITLDGQGQTRIMYKESGANLTVQNLNFVNGKAPDSETHFRFDTGGAILAEGQGTTLTIINSSFQNNTVTNINGSDIAGGAIFMIGMNEGVISGSLFEGNTASNGGAIGVLASGLRVINSQFSNNGAVGDGSDFSLRGHGGAINMDGVTNSNNPDSNKILWICGSRFSGNEADNQGGATNTVFSDGEGSKVLIEQSVFENNRTTGTTRGNGGAVFHVEDDLAGASSEDNFEITRTTFNGNVALKQGGAVWYLINGQASISNNSFYNNRTTDDSLGMGGAMAISSATDYSSFHEVTNNTIANNYAWFHGGGIQAATSPQVKLTNNIFYYNESERDWGSYQMNRAADVDGGGNIQYPAERFNQSGTPNDGKVTDSVMIVDPLLAALADNGGPNQTMALQASSPAIDAGVSGCPAIDQRGMARQGSCDVGAFELVDATPTPTPMPISTASPTASATPMPTATMPSSTTTTPTVQPSVTITATVPPSTTPTPDYEHALFLPLILKGG